MASNGVKCLARYRESPGWLGLSGDLGPGGAAVPRAGPTLESRGAEVSERVARQGLCGVPPPNFVPHITAGAIVPAVEPKSGAPVERGASRRYRWLPPLCRYHSLPWTMFHLPARRTRCPHFPDWAHRSLEATPLLAYILGQGLADAGNDKGCSQAFTVKAERVRLGFGAPTDDCGLVSARTVAVCVEEGCSRPGMKDLAENGFRSQSGCFSPFR